MAEVPVEKRSGSKAWIWLLIAAVAIAVFAWWMFADRPYEEDTPYDSNRADMTSVEEVSGIEDDVTLALGERARLQDVQVISLAGDRAFYVAHHGGQIPVFFDENAMAITPAESFELREGMTVNLTGQVHAATDPLPEGADESVLGQSQLYIRAIEIEPVS